jgi:ligand-binding SRPBCC domain-containing protein
LLNRHDAYYLKRKQFLPLSLDEAWVFFSNPKNLARITPATMKFDIRHISGTTNRMYAGQLISYRIQIMPFYSTNWLTEITHVNEPYYFVDEQRFGPYALWHHQHHFVPVDGGVEMTDEVTYAIPFGFIGRLANSLFVHKRLNAIFDYRQKVLKEIFSNRKIFI